MEDTLPPPPGTVSPPPMGLHFCLESIEGDNSFCRDGSAMSIVPFTSLSLPLHFPFTPSLFFTHLPRR